MRALHKEHCRLALIALHSRGESGCFQRQVSMLQENLVCTPFKRVDRSSGYFLSWVGDRYIGVSGGTAPQLTY